MSNQQTFPIDCLLGSRTNPPFQGNGTKMNTKVTAAFIAVAALTLARTGLAVEPKVLQLEEPVMAQVRMVQPFEVVAGTYISLVLTSAEPMMVSAVVSTDIYDRFENVVIPKGSKLIGREIRQVRDRHDIAWTGLQIPAVPGTLRLDPPLKATMPDGSAGVTGMEPGALLGTIIGEPFIVPH